MKFAEGVLPLSNFPSLENLAIPQAEHKPDFLSQLERVKNVKKINLSYMNVSDQIIRHLEQLPHLKVVYLSGCKISDLALERLAKKVQIIR
jgi:Leucine-rich repeat (LRR) protein